MIRSLRLLVAAAAIAGAAFVPARAAERLSTNLVETALAVNAQSGEFSTLIALVVEFDLVGALSNPDQDYTVFAPTDAAFLNTLGITAADVPGLASSDLAPVVIDILLYHVVPGFRQSQSVVNARQIRALNGDFIRPRGTVLNGTVNIVGPFDVRTANGVIHTIDAVLLPPSN